MIIVGNNKVIDIVINNEYISRGVYYDDNLNSSVIFSKSLNFIGATSINTGDISEYKLIINGIEYTDITIVSNNENIVIKNNKCCYTKAGKYELTLSYKTFTKTIIVNVVDLTFTIA